MFKAGRSSYTRHHVRTHGVRLGNTTYMMGWSSTLASTLRMISPCGVITSYCCTAAGTDKAERGLATESLRKATFLCH